MIDPVLSYSTYLGGSSEELVSGITVDRYGNAYVTGSTYSTNFPTTAGALDRTGGDGNALVTKLNATGSRLLYSTYLGGSEDDAGLGIAVDSSANAYVTGMTNSTNFPTKAGAYDRSFNGGYWDTSVTKLNATGSRLLYSTFLGGSGFDSGNDIAVRVPSDTQQTASAEVYVTGMTNRTDFPTTPGAYDRSFAGGSCGRSGVCHNAFVTKLVLPATQQTAGGNQSTGMDRQGDEVWPPAAGAGGIARSH